MGYAMQTDNNFSKYSYDLPLENLWSLFSNVVTEQDMQGYLSLNNIKKQ